MKKKKLWSSVPVWLASFLFISSWVVFGVTLALKTANVGLNGNVTFTATGVYAKVSGNISGTATENTLEDITINASTTNENQSWKNVSFDFKDENTPIVTTITVENLSTERSIWLSFAENISVTNITLARTSDGSSVTSFSTIEMPASSSKSFTITMKVDDKTKNVSGTFDFNIELSNDEPVLDASAYPNLEFDDYDSSTHTTKVRAKNYPAGDLVIPSKVSIDGVEYTVTQIFDQLQGFYDSTITSIYIPATITGFSGGGIKLFPDTLTSATFEVTEGWKITRMNSSGEVTGREDCSSFTDKSYAASILRSLASEDYLYRSN